MRGVRSDSATALIVRGLPATPVLTSATVQRIHGVSHVVADRALAELAASDILHPQERRGVRYHQARDVLDLVTVTERRLASTKFDTRASQPTRPVPARRDQGSGAVPGDDVTDIMPGASTVGFTGSASPPSMPSGVALTTRSNPVGSAVPALERPRTSPPSSPSRPVTRSSSMSWMTKSLTPASSRAIAMARPAPPAPIAR